MITVWSPLDSPWADSAKEVADHRLEIALGARTASLFDHCCKGHVDRLDDIPEPW